MKLHPKATNKKTLKSFETLEARCNKVHNNKYNYNDYIYLNNVAKSIIICPIHGKFSQNIGNHIDGRGCPCCGTEKTNGLKRRSQTNTIKIATALHKGLYDYSIFKYKNNKTKSTIICKTHGNFLQAMDKHLKGHGCQKCAREEIAKDNMHSIKDIVIKANIKHNNIYDYSKFIYNGINKSSIIVCKKHGEFKQSMNHHLRGQYCPSCTERRGDNDCLYVWKIKGTDVYKIGVTSYRLKHKRIKSVAKEHEVEYDIIIFKKVDNAMGIESELHSIFKKKQNLIKSGDGYTEFKTLSNEDLAKLTKYVKEY